MRIFNYFTKAERGLWCASVLLIVVTFCAFDRVQYLTLAASLIGVTSLLFNAKANPAGQFLTVVFSLIYGAISYNFAYYGEMFTYLGMTMPMALFALFAWLKNPYNGNRAEVAVNRLAKAEWLLIALATAAVTLLFYFVLKAFGTANLLFSTLSVATSFAAVTLTFRRSAYYALAYAANDIVLVVLWALAAAQDKSCLSVVACFVAFLANDIYGYKNWKKIQARQAQPVASAGQGMVQ